MEAGIKSRKRKASSHDGELSKRFKKLNIERDHQTLHIPLTTTPVSPPPKPSHVPNLPSLEEDSMLLDNTKYKVYIHNIDDELSSDSEAEEGKLVFLPDIEKHIRNMHVQIPRSLLPKEEGNDRQLVLYGVPSSLSVPEERDSVRKAIIETRARAREKGMDSLGGGGFGAGLGNGGGGGVGGVASLEVGAGVGGGGRDGMVVEPLGSVDTGGVADVMVVDDQDPDAMDLDLS